MAQGQFRRILARAAITGVMAMAIASPLSAGVQEGVDAWSRGDYETAVAEWQGLAARGDADAMFNLAQAYRLGRGVPRDMPRALQLYGSAAEAGHIQAADTYGLMLFQDGAHEKALPYVVSAARRGDPRAQYLLGVAHFNGEIVQRDWLRAYALLTLANGQQLPQAASTLVQMDKYIPLVQRQQAAALARQLEAEAQEARSVELAAADLAMQSGAAKVRPARVAGNVPGANRVPTPIESTPVAPSISAGQTALAEAKRATGTESPASAGATYAAPPRPAPVVASKPAAATPRPSAKPAAQVVASGPWRVQLGAFSVSGSAEKLWAKLAGRAELSGRERLLVPVPGRSVTKLQAGGFATSGDAQRACNALKASGQDCLVTR